MPEQALHAPPLTFEEALAGADGVVWALGISQTEVNEEDYIKITKDYTLEAAKTFSGLSGNFKFVYVSGEGATTTPGMFTPLFGRVSGNATASPIRSSIHTPASPSR